MSDAKEEVVETTTPVETVATVESTETHAVDPAPVEVTPSTETTNPPVDEKPKDSSNVSGTLSDLDPETLSKVQQAFTEHGIDYESALAGDKNSSTYVDPAKVVKDFDKMTPEIQEKIRAAFNDPKLKAKIANNDIENQLNLEKEMDEIRKNIKWDEIEKDSDGIPVLNDKDKSRIISVGASKKDEIEIIIQSARASVKTARSELDELATLISENNTILARVKDAGVSEDENKKFDNEMEAAKKDKEKLDNKKKSAEDLEKSSIETLAVFQELARKTVQNLVDDNAFLRALSLVSTKIFMTTYEDGIKHGVSNVVYDVLKDVVKGFNNPPYEFNDYILSAVNPFVKANFSFFDALLHTHVSSNKYDNAKEELRVGNNDVLLKQIESFNTSLENALRQPFMIASRYCDRIDSIFSNENEFKPFNNSAKEALGWPKTTDYTNDNELVKNVNITINELEDIINVNYATLRERIGILSKNYIIYLKKISESKKNIFTKELSAYLQCYYINFVVPLFNIITVGSVSNPVKGEDGKVEYKVVELSEVQIKRYMYLAITYIALSLTYHKAISKLHIELGNHPDFEGHKDSVNDVFRYINSEFFLSLEILFRYDSSKTGEDYNVEKFINEDIYKNLSKEVFVAFKDLNVDEARKNYVDSTLESSNYILMVAKYIFNSILDSNSAIYTTTK